MDGAARLALPPEFFQRPTLQVAPELLGLWLTRRAPRGGAELAFQFTEVEAYLGPEDLASHARFGSRARNGVMFGPGGHWYVYLIYGIHQMLNIVTGPPGEAGAALIRGLAGLPGPGRLTKRLGIGAELNGLPCAPASGLWIERRGPPPPPEEIGVSPRIGVDYAGPDWGARPYRFYWKKHLPR